MRFISKAQGLRFTSSILTESAPSEMVVAPSEMVVAGAPATTCWFRLSMHITPNPSMNGTSASHGIATRSSMQKHYNRYNNRIRYSEGLNQARLVQLPVAEPCSRPKASRYRIALPFRSSIMFGSMRHRNNPAICSSCEMRYTMMRRS